MGWPLNRSRWRKKNLQIKIYLAILSLSLTSLLFYMLSSSLSFLFPKTFFDSQTATIQCGAQSLAGERFLWYAPHSGFSNQLAELKNAIIFASILNRTLIVPPVLDHHAVSLGSCPKFRVTKPSDLRNAVWDHILQLIRDRRYISMADIIDLSTISPRTLKIIDFRFFASLWCDLNMDSICYGNLSANYCRSLMSGSFKESHCIHYVEEDCKTTVWTYQQGEDGALDSFQQADHLPKRKKIFYVRKRKDLYKAFGPGSIAGMAKILAFGSLFTSPYKASELYIDIHEAPKDDRIQTLLQDIQFLPFAPELITAGKEIVQKMIKAPFLCAQLRLLDGQFKSHWKTTFSAFREKLSALHLELNAKNDSGLIHIFLMTDLLASSWTGTYLEVISNNTKYYKLYSMNEKYDWVVQAAKRLVAAEHGLKSGFIPKNINSVADNWVCSPALLPDILLYIEEIVCSCASMGFVGTSGSTITDSILLMRKNNVCQL